MLSVIEKILVVITAFLVSIINSSEGSSMKNQECKVREEIITVNNNEPVSK